MASWNLAKEITINLYVHYLRSLFTFNCWIYPLWVYRLLKYPKSISRIFLTTWWGKSKNIEENEFSRWLFEGRLRQGKNVLPDGLNWLCYLAGSSKSYRDNSISCIFLESPHQVDMENVVKWYKHFFGYFNALKTHSAYVRVFMIITTFLTWNSTTGDTFKSTTCYQRQQP